MRRAFAAALAAILASSCAASLMKLPAGRGTPAVNAPGAIAESTAACQRVQTFTALIAVTGSVNGQRLRARLDVGLAPPDSVMLEASALSQKLFIFVSRANDATLLLQRDNRILEHGPPGAILEAVTGVPLDPALLRTTVTGCAKGLTADGAHQFGEDWMSVPDANGTVYLQRTPHQAPWRLVAAIRHDETGAEWTAEYREIVDGVPRDIRLRSAPDGKRFNLKLVLTQVETNETLDATAFRVVIPASADPLTLNELRESGPLGAPARPGPNNSGTKMTAPGVRVAAFAKINLSLQLIGVRADGYHEVRTRVQSLALHDTLTCVARNGPFQITSNDPACPTDSTNLVWRAAERLWRAAGHRSSVAGAAVHIVKSIPMQAGLGGGSSDAAAALRALAAIWRLDLTASRVQRIASALGADVPFFLEGGAALGIGRGDVLIPAPDPRRSWVVLVLPDFGVSTRDAYGWWDADNPTLVSRSRSARPVAPAGRRSSDVREILEGGIGASGGNDLEAPVVRRHPEIGRIVRALGRAGAAHAAMSGSGSAVFGLFDSRAGADAAADAVRNRSRRTLVTRMIDRVTYARRSRPR